MSSPYYSSPFPQDNSEETNILLAIPIFADFKPFLKVIYFELMDAYNYL
jgi:hypothetical protein